MDILQEKSNGMKMEDILKGIKLCKQSIEGFLDAQT
jgi:hypothetical protein